MFKTSMPKDLEERLKSFSIVFKENDKVPDSINSINYVIKDYISNYWKDLEKIRDLNDQNFIAFESSLYSYLRKYYIGKTPLTSKVLDVADYFVGLEHVQAPIDKIREMVKVYMVSKDLYEGKLAGLDSETFRQVRSDVYQVLKRVYKR